LPTPLQERAVAAQLSLDERDAPDDHARRQRLAALCGPGWAERLIPVADRIAALGDFLRAEQAAGRRFLPAGERIFAAFRQPFDDVRVLIVGQDPYPTPGHPIGLSFSVAPDVQPLPGSLQNIFREYGDDLGYPAPGNGDLTPWARQGVMLLNRVLTVQAGRPASHRGQGWEEVTAHAIRELAARERPLVAVLWGKDARGLKPLLGDTPVVESPHPSPLSARYGFLGSRPFSRANALLERQGGEPVDWRLP
jgi:uracil-DNA glycosylase